MSEGDRRYIVIIRCPKCKGIKIIYDSITNLMIVCFKRCNLIKTFYIVKNGIP
jgi:uncharacterized protein YbaR (Trm112 family)